MEYLILFGITISIITAYHYFKYRNSTYSKFEYYLNGEVGDVGIMCVVLFEIISVLVGVVCFIFLGGEIIKWITN